MGGVDKMALGRGKEAIKEYLESLDKYVKRGAIYRSAIIGVRPT
jgi:hypothetical protein